MTLGKSGIGISKQLEPLDATLSIKISTSILQFVSHSGRERGKLQRTVTYTHFSDCRSSFFYKLVRVFHFGGSNYGVIMM